MQRAVACSNSEAAQDVYVNSKALDMLFARLLLGHGLLRVHDLLLHRGCQVVFCFLPRTCALVVVDANFC